MVVHTRTSALRRQNQPQLHSESQASLGYMRLCLLSSGKKGKLTHLSTYTLKKKTNTTSLCNAGCLGGSEVAQAGLELTIFLLLSLQWSAIHPLILIHILSLCAIAQVSHLETIVGVRNLKWLILVLISIITTNFLLNVFAFLIDKITFMIPVMPSLPISPSLLFFYLFIFYLFFFFFAVRVLLHGQVGWL